MRELLIADVDGTIVRNDIPETHPEYDMPSPRAIEAVRYMHYEGRFLSPATSRTPRMMGHVAAAFNLHELGVLNGGATIFNFATNERVHELSRELDPAKVARVLSALGHYCTEIYYGEKLGRRTPATIDLAEISPQGAPSVFAVFENDKGPMIRYTLSGIDGLSVHPNIYENTTTHSCVQVVAKGVGKKSGAKLLLQSEQYRGLHGEDIAVIGDGRNDGELFDAMPPGALKLAMGNAGQELKDKADIVVPHVRDDGFAIAIEDYVLR